MFSGKALKIFLNLLLITVILGAGQSTSSGRATGTRNYEEFESTAAKRLPLTEEHFIEKLANTRAELKAANLAKAELATKLKDKEFEIRSYAKKVTDLERRVQQLGKRFHFIDEFPDS